MAGVEGLKAANALVAQIVTVSAGLLAFTVTFAEKFTPKDQMISPPASLKVAWICFAVTILFGFWTLMATTGTLNEIDSGKAESNPERWNIRIPAALAILVFLMGAVALIVAGWTMTRGS
jgi:hypothetical protein